MKKHLLICVALLAMAAPAWADAPLTLSDACRIAVQNHPRLQAARLAGAEASEGVTMARADYLPQISGEGVRAYARANSRIGAPGGLNDPTVIDRGSLGIGVSQLITDFGRTSDLIASSKMRLQAANARTQDTEQSVVLNATRAYFNVLRAQALLRVADETFRARKTLLDQVTTLGEAKLRSDLDVSIAQQSVADANLLVLKARTGVDDAYAALAEALGDEGLGHVTLAQDMDLTPPPGDLAGELSTGAVNNPLLRSLAADAAAARKQADAEGAAELPRISAAGYAGVNPERDPASNLKSNYAVGGFTVDVPIFTGGRLSARAHQASLHADALNALYKEQKNVLARDINVAFGDTQTAFENISVTEQLRHNAETTLDLTQTRYRIGKSSIVDLNQAQLAATQAEIVHTDALYTYRIQRALLDYETGRLSPDAG
jgi:outer membrane protein